MTRVSFVDTTSRGFTQAQLASTASYQAKDLPGIRLGGNDLTGWDFSEQNLTGAQLGGYIGNSTLTNANLTGANFSAGPAKLDAGQCQLDRGGGDGSLGSSKYRAFTQAQLASTASYQAKDLQGISLWGNDLTGWDFSEQISPAWTTRARC